MKTYNDAALLICDPLQPIGQDGSERDVEARYAAFLASMWAKATVLRQKRLPSGLRPDILVYVGSSKCLAVIELKRGTAAHRHVSQLRRYMRELAHLHPEYWIVGQIVADELPNDVVTMNEDIYFTRPGPRPIQYDTQHGGPEHITGPLQRIVDGLNKRQREIH